MPTVTKYSYVRPVDRPSTLFCRVCAKEDENRETKNGKPLPSDISLLRHIPCNSTGALVWTWRTWQEEEAPAPKKWEPHCGDPKCTGLCMDPECVPPEEPKKEIVLPPTAVPVRYRLKYFALGVVIHQLFIYLLDLLGRLT